MLPSMAKCSQVSRQRVPSHHGRSWGGGSWFAGLTADVFKKLINFSIRAASDAPSVFGGKVWRVSMTANRLHWTLGKFGASSISFILVVVHQEDLLHLETISFIGLHVHVYLSQYLMFFSFNETSKTEFLSISKELHKTVSDVYKCACVHPPCFLLLFLIIFPLFVEGQTVDVTSWIQSFQLAPAFLRLHPGRRSVPASNWDGVRWRGGRCSLARQRSAPGVHSQRRSEVRCICTSLLTSRCYTIIDGDHNNCAICIYIYVLM